MKFSVAPVVRVAVEPKHPCDLPKLVEGLNRRAKSDPCIVCSFEETGEHIIAGCGELYLEICLKDLEEVYAQVPIKKSPPVVSFRETVTRLTDTVCMSKSANKLNRLMAQALPLEEGLLNPIENGVVNPCMDVKARARELQKTYGWEQSESRRVWSFGPDSSGPNLLVDVTKSAEYLQEVKEHFVSAFQWATKQGVLSEEPLRGVRFNIVEVFYQGDASHRNGGQIVPTGRRVLYAAEYTAGPTLVEPCYLAEITVPKLKKIIFIKV
jgi:elongation factor 2